MKKLNLDTFGEIMDHFIKENEIQMLITLPAGSITAEVQDNCKAGAVVQFYIVLDAISSIANQMRKEMGGIDGTDWENIVDALLELLKKDLLDPKSENAGEEQHETD